jgi:hypothetical protein
MMEFRNPTFTSQGTIDCEINHPTHGWIPFTASNEDPAEFGQEMFAGLKEFASAYVVPQLPEPSPYVASDLSPRRFEYLLALTGLDDVWAALEAELKATDRAMFAQIKAQRSALSFSQEKTLGLIAVFADTAKRVAPDADLSDDAIKAAWVDAEKVQL